MLRLFTASPIEADGSFHLRRIVGFGSKIKHDTLKERAGQVDSLSSVVAVPKEVLEPEILDRRWGAPDQENSLVRPEPPLKLLQSFRIVLTKPAHTWWRFEETKSESTEGWRRWTDLGKDHLLEGGGEGAAAHSLKLLEFGKNRSLPSCSSSSWSDRRIPNFLPENPRESQVSQLQD